MPYAHFTYTVIGQRVVLPTDVAAAVSNVGYTRLVLSACTPLFSAEKRLLVYARLTTPCRSPPGRPPAQLARAAPHRRGRRARWRAARAPQTRGGATSGARSPRAGTASPRRLSSVAPGGPSRTRRRSS